MPDHDRDGPALHAPATLRNREAILDVLRRVLPREGLVLEIASGTGEHAAYLARGLPGLAWRPSDPDPEMRASIAAHARMAGLPNLLPPLALDARAPDWPPTRAEAVVCINMVHIAPWPAAQGLMRGAGRLLPAGACLYLYGPFTVAGAHTAPTNAAFDASLRARDPEWGLRDLAEIAGEAALHGFGLVESIPMPANNLSLIFRKPE